MMDWLEVYKGSGEHLQRVMREYKELGYETRIESIGKEEMSDECISCGAQFRLLVKKVEENGR